ncbi:MAG: hypothetical protein N3E52_06290 [Candidatus Bathyarchaeota archaeon]|nr:hypothetical protein [Candidatus Bathyarchaeota archaeon]
MKALDIVLGGGFPRKSLIVLAGSPGTGKTIFSAQFLYRGCVVHGEKGVYASFAESKNAFYENMAEFGFDFEKLEAAGKFRFLELSTVKEKALPTVIELILKEVTEIGAKRLVIDSFSALAQAFTDRHEGRVVLHSVISKIFRVYECTTLLIVEQQCESKKEVNLGIEGFVADGIIYLKRGSLAHRPLRELELLKMRGTPTPETHLAFTLKDGFTAFPAFKAKQVKKPQRFMPQPDTNGSYSTGSADLDKILGGGYQKGSPVLIEIGEEVSTFQYHLLLVPTAWNFIVQRRGVIVIPSAGADHNVVSKRAEEGGITSEELNSLVRVCIKEYPGIKLEPYIVSLMGNGISEDYARYLAVERELAERTSQPTLCITGADMLVGAYGIKDTLATLKLEATRIRETGSLGIVLLKPGYHRLAKILGAIAEVHLKVKQKHGKIFVYGVKPRTNLYALEVATAKGYILPKLTPII